ncbi:MAG: hypothetical protein EPO03_00020 [Porticoccaceae bacterium]|nr:MAG: hypothetical protein EPO03_00020 [Porticoccaceae bacterium]
MLKNYSGDHLLRCTVLAPSPIYFRCAPHASQLTTSRRISVTVSNPLLALNVIDNKIGADSEFFVIAKVYPDKTHPPHRIRKVAMSNVSSRSIFRAAAVAGALALAPIAAHADQLMWIDHLGFLAGDPSVNVSFNAVNSGVGSGLSGLIIQSTTTGEDADGGGNKVIETSLAVPPGYLVDGVRVCYELSNASSFISQIRLAQVQDPPATAMVLLDDAANLTDPGPVCADSAILTTPAHPADGALLLSLRVNFGDVADKIVVRGVALHLAMDPKSLLMTHTHRYLTGRGVGQNNTVVQTSGPVDPPAPAPAPTRR